MGRWIEIPRGITPALDVTSLNQAMVIVENTMTIDGVVAYKVGKLLGLRFGLEKVISELNAITTHPIIYDDQKSPSDIPRMAEEFVDLCAECGVENLIGFPHSGPASLEAFLKQCLKHGIRPIIGLHMTHPKYLVEEGGWVSDKAPREAFQIALDHGVVDFVVPGTKPDSVLYYYQLLSRGIKTEKANELRLHAPGFIGQGGNITECGEVAGPRWCGILGSVFTNHLDDPLKIHQVGLEMVSQIQN